MKKNVNNVLKTLTVLFVFCLMGINNASAQTKTVQSKSRISTNPAMDGSAQNRQRAAQAVAVQQNSRQQQSNSRSNSNSGGMRQPTYDELHPFESGSQR